jgi:hypothetical protein
MDWCVVTFFSVGKLSFDRLTHEFLLYYGASLCDVTFYVTSTSIYHRFIFFLQVFPSVTVNGYDFGSCAILTWTLLVSGLQLFGLAPTNCIWFCVFEQSYSALIGWIWDIFTASCECLHLYHIVHSFNQLELSFFSFTCLCCIY